MTIFWRQFLSSCLIIFLVLFLFTIIAISEIKKFDELVTKERLLTTANLIGEFIKSPVSEDRREEIQHLVSEIGRKNDIRITLIRNDGVVIAESERDPRGIENHAKRPEVMTAVSKGIGQSIRHSSTIDKDMFYVAIPIENRQGSVEAVVRTALPLSSIGETFATIQSKVIYLGLGLMLLALLLSYASSNSSAAELQKIISVSEEIAKGNFNISLPVTETKGEIGELTLAINKMASELRDLFRQVSLEKAQLKAVLGAMNEGVIVVSNEGKITLINTALREMFNIKDDPFEKPYWEVFRNKEVIEIVENVLTKRSSAKKEFSLFYPSERYYLANAIPLDSPEKEAIVVIFDITDFKGLEKIKADLVANVSHELRTPLTAIKGYIETLQENSESPEERKHFLTIMKRNTDRLINIVADLLVLSEVESKDALWRENPRADFEEIHLKEIVSSSFDALKSKIVEKNIQVSLSVEDTLPCFKGNKFLLEQMIINLMDNAVKYTPEGGSVGVSVSKHGSEFKIEVSDTGMGIPKEHLTRIFERFYRVDKTRSRKQGGTGLGLSIVKHIAIMHDGKINVQSEEGKGSKFIVTLPG